jgi:hypothetical protein
MGIAIGIILTVILIALIVMSRRNKVTTKKHAPPVGGRDLAKTGSQFHAVSIQTSDTACDAAKALQGKRILAGAAPRIPLPECDAPQCKCRFSHHQDRRRREDRRGQIPEDMLGTTGGYSGKERRFHERRNDDEPEDFFS